MYYEGVSDDLPIEAIVARNMGDEDWADLCTCTQLSEGCSRKSATYSAERDKRFDRFEAEPVTVKDLTFKVPTGMHRRP